MQTLLESPNVFPGEKRISDVLVLVYIPIRFLNRQPGIRYLVKTSFYKQCLCTLKQHSVLKMEKRHTPDLASSPVPVFFLFFKRT